LDSQFDPEVLSHKVRELYDFLGDIEAPKEVIELALKKCNLSLEEAIGMLVSAETVAEL